MSDTCQRAQTLKNAKDKICVEKLFVRHIEISYMSLTLFPGNSR